MIFRQEAEPTMSRIFLALTGLCLLAAPALAQTYTDGRGTIIASVRPTYLYASAGPSQMGLPVLALTTLSVPQGATIAQICVETSGVRYRDDGTAPTAASGQPVAAGACFSYAGSLSSLQFVAQSGSPTIDVSYYK
jgi:hypothetical protein